MDSIDQWANSCHSGTKPGYNNSSKGNSIDRLERDQIKNRKGFFDSQVLPKLKKNITKN